MLDLLIVLLWSAAFVALLSSLITSNYLDFRVARSKKKLDDVKGYVNIQNEAIQDLMQKLRKKDIKIRDLNETLATQHYVMQDLLIAKMAPAVKEEEQCLSKTATKTEDPPSEAMFHS